MMMKDIENLADLDAAVAASSTQPILIFKHSLTCGTSALAYEEIDDHLTSGREPREVYLVRIQTARAVSNEISARFRIRHESPQALLLDRGSVVWHGSHYHVNAAEIEAAVNQPTPPARPAPGPPRR